MSTVTQTIRQAIIDAVLQIAPEADFARVDAKRSLRQQLDIDSFDFLNLLIDLHARLGVEIPEADYAKVDTLGGDGGVSGGAGGSEGERWFAVMSSRVCWSPHAVRTALVEAPRPSGQTPCRDYGGPVRPG